MSRRFLAFDIETAKAVPGPDFNWKLHRPLGISCLATLASGEDRPRVWLSRNDDGTPAPQMSAADLSGFVHWLLAAAADGFTILTWNGLAFDFDILAEESGMGAECQQLATAHVDMMFHIVCEKGFPVALKNAASGLKVPGKLAGVSGIDAPALWAAGKFETVADYVAQDVRTTLAVAVESERRKNFAWTTRRGTLGSMSLSGGWLTVEAACKLPKPDTSWMPDPPSRGDFRSWFRKA